MSSRADSSDEHRRNGPLAMSLAVCILLIMYPISYGPVYRLATDGWLPYEILAIYRPLGRVLGDSPMVDGLREWYEDAWSWSFDD